MKLGMLDDIVPLVDVTSLDDHFAPWMNDRLWIE